MDQLASKVTALSSLKSEESDEVNQLILNKIVTLTLKDAEKLLNEKQFSDAIDSVDQGLSYASKNSKLLSFKDRITKNKQLLRKQNKNELNKQWKWRRRRTYTIRHLLSA